MKSFLKVKQNNLLKICWISIVLITAATILSVGTQLFIEAQSDYQQKNAEKERIAIVKSILAKKEAKRKEPVYISLPNTNKIRAIVDDFSQPDSIWTIVSKTHEISTDYTPSPLIIPDVPTRTDKSSAERSVKSDIAPALKTMFDEAAKYSYQLMIGSGYRSAGLQAIYFNSLANSVGDAAANQSIARPGQSEHQTGLAVDISTVSRNCYLQECFADTSDGQWLADNSYKYGFILRFPKGREFITGYQYEPWHFRYVGVDLATALHESNLTLDEAWPYLKKALTTLKSNGAI